MKKNWLLMLAAGVVLGLSGFAVSTNVNASSYYRSNPNIVRVKRGLEVYKNAQRTRKDFGAGRGDFFKTNGVNNKYHDLVTNRNLYLTANKRFVTASKGYQNPRRYYQVNYKQIKPYGKVGHNIGIGYEGIKSWKVEKRTGTYNGYTKYSYATKYAVENFQRRHHLPVTGRVNERTWVKMGFPKKEWYSIDAYVAPLGAKAWQGRHAHIEAAIRQAKKYLGKPFLDGCSSSPRYGTDCSGLVMQALYAGGINPKPVSSIYHGYPGNEWNSRNLWRSRKFKHVPFRDRQRGDLIFYYEPGTYTIYHVALYLGHDRVIDSWPDDIAIRNLWGVHPDIAGVARPWI